MNIYKILKTILHNSKFLLSVSIVPFLAGCIALLLLTIIRRKKNKQPVYTSFHLPLSLFTLVFYLGVVLQITLFMRIGSPVEDPLGYVFDGWGATQNRYYYDFTFLENIIMFIPISSVFVFFRRNFKIVNINQSLIIKYTLLSFAFSLFIETMQIITRLGTFQISDIFYNTLGGFIGSILFILIVKKSHKKRRKP